jgi:hypothetical protein
MVEKIGKFWAYGKESWNVVCRRNLEFTADIALVHRYSLLGDGRNTAISLCEGSSMETTLTVFEGSCDGVLCVHEFYCYYPSTIQWIAELDTTYYLLVRHHYCPEFKSSLYLTPTSHLINCRFMDPKVLSEILESSR